MASSLNGTHKEHGALQAVADAYLEAEAVGLHIEVFYTAFKYLKENPDTSIHEALSVGLNDWDV